MPHVEAVRGVAYVLRDRERRLAQGERFVIGEDGLPRRLRHADPPEQPAGVVRQVAPDGERLIVRFGLDPLPPDHWTLIVDADDWTRWALQNRVDDPWRTPASFPVLASLKYEDPLRVEAVVVTALDAHGLANALAGKAIAMALKLGTEARCDQCGTSAPTDDDFLLRLRRGDLRCPNHAHPDRSCDGLLELQGAR